MASVASDARDAALQVNKNLESVAFMAEDWKAILQRPDSELGKRKFKVGCDACGRNESLALFHREVFTMWNNRPLNATPLPKTCIAPSPTRIGDGLFAEEDICKGTIVAYYPNHAVLVDKDVSTGKSSMIGSLGSASQMAAALKLEKRNEYMTTHLGNTCGFQLFTLPHSQYPGRDDERGHIVNDSIELSSLTPVFGQFLTNPSLEGRRMFDEAVNRFASSANCFMVKNCPEMNNTGTYFMGIKGGKTPLIVPVCCLIASRDIKQGEEFLVSYGSEYWFRLIASKKFGFEGAITLSATWPQQVFPEVV